MNNPSTKLLDNIGAPYICLKMGCGYTADNIEAVIQHMEEDHPEVIEFIEKMEDTKMDSEFPTVGSIEVTGDELKILEVLVARNAHLLYKEYQVVPTWLIKRDLDASNNLMEKIDNLMHDLGMNKIHD